jgi:hypothetical protein
MSQISFLMMVIKDSNHFFSKAIKELLYAGLFALLIILSLEKCIAQSKITDHKAKSVDVQIDLNKVNHTMAGGIGASWHAMGADVINYPDLIGRDNRACKGSAYEGNPPVFPAYDKALVRPRFYSCRICNGHV